MTTESNVRSDPQGTPPRSGLDAYFHISERGSSVEREIRGGFATFFTMAYIVVLNPLILAGAEDVTASASTWASSPPRPPWWRRP